MPRSMIPSTDLRVMEIPANKVGLGEGEWLRWPELKALLVERGDTELVDLLERTINSESRWTREVKVRR